MRSDISIWIKDKTKSKEDITVLLGIDAPVVDKMADGLTLVYDEDGLSLHGYGLSYIGDFRTMLRRISGGRLAHEMLARAAKTDKANPRAIDATAGMGEDSILIAAAGYEVTLCERNPVVAALLMDALERAKADPELSEIVGRMNVFAGDSIEYLRDKAGEVDLIYLDPMFPERQKSGLVNKKLQLIQKLEAPCFDEVELFAAAIEAAPKKIVVKRPLKAPNLADKKPNYMLKGKAIRYDCYAVSK